MAGSHFPGSRRATDSQAPQEQPLHRYSTGAGAPSPISRVLGKQSARRGRARTRSRFWSGSTRVGRAPTRNSRRSSPPPPPPLWTCTPCMGPARKRPAADEVGDISRSLPSTLSVLARPPRPWMLPPVTRSAKGCVVSATVRSTGSCTSWPPAWHIGLVDIEVPRERDGLFGPGRVGRWHRPLGGSMARSEPAACAPPHRNSPQIPQSSGRHQGEELFGSGQLRHMRGAACDHGDLDVDVVQSCFVQGTSEALDPYLGGAAQGDDV
jgi:hypothetical protein